MEVESGSSWTLITYIFVPEQCALLITEFSFMVVERDKYGILSQHLCGVLDTNSNEVVVFVHQSNEKAIVAMHVTIT
jgi:hypothetical protein